MLGESVSFKDHDYTIRRKYLSRRRSRAATTLSSEVDSRKCDIASDDEIKGMTSSTSTTDDEELLIGGSENSSANVVVGVTTVATGPQWVFIYLQLLPLMDVF